MLVIIFSRIQLFCSLIFLIFSFYIFWLYFLNFFLLSVSFFYLTLLKSILGAILGLEQNWEKSTEIFHVYMYSLSTYQYPPTEWYVSYKRWMDNWHIKIKVQSLCKTLLLVLYMLWVWANIYHTSNKWYHKA